MSAIAHTQNIFMLTIPTCDQKSCQIDFFIPVLLVSCVKCKPLFLIELILAVGNKKSPPVACM